MTKKTSKRSKVNEKYYVDPVRFTKEIKEFNALCAAEKRLTDDKDPTIFEDIPKYVVESVVKMAEKISTNARFRGYSYKDEMIQDGILIGLKAIKKIKPERDSAFSYITTSIINAFEQRRQKEKRQQYYKEELTKNGDILNHVEIPKDLDHDALSQIANSLNDLKNNN